MEQSDGFAKTSDVMMTMTSVAAAVLVAASTGECAFGVLLFACVLTFGFPSCRGVERACLCCSTCFLGAFLRRRALSSSHLKISGVWGMIMGNDMGVGRCSRFSFSVFSAADRPVPSVLSLDSRGFFYYNNKSCLFIKYKPRGRGLLGP